MKPPKKRHKYPHILEERTCEGKSYAEYLRDAGMKLPRKENDTRGLGGRRTKACL